MISIIVPVYNVEDYLKRCIDSICRQTFEDWELILVDDGSTDQSGAICDDYAARDPRIKPLHKKNGGAASARNAALDWIFASSSSQWVAFVDSDDEVSPDYLSTLYSTAAKHKADLCICDFYTIKTDGEPGDDSLPIPSLCTTGRTILEDREFGAKWRYVVPWNKLYRKELFEGLRFPVGYICEDEAVVHRILGAAQTVVCIPDRLYTYYLRTNSVSGGVKTVKNTDNLFAISDRIRYAKKQQLPACRAGSVWQYLWFLLEVALPLLARSEKGGPYLKRSARATRAVLPDLLRSKSRSGREKLRVVLFSLFPHAYLAHARRNIRKR